MIKHHDADKIVYLVRHGQSKGNVAFTYSDLEAPLTEKGKEQSELLAKHL